MKKGVDNNYQMEYNGTMKRNRRILTDPAYLGIHRAIAKGGWVFAFIIIGIMLYGVFCFIAPVLGMLWAMMCASPILFILGVCVIGWLLFIGGVLILAMLS